MDKGLLKQICHATSIFGIEIHELQSTKIRKEMRNNIFNNNFATNQTLRKSIP